MNLLQENAIKNSIISFVLGDMMRTPVQFIFRPNLKESLKQAPISELILNTNRSIKKGLL